MANKKKSVVQQEQNETFEFNLSSLLTPFAIIVGAMMISFTILITFWGSDLTSSNSNTSSNSGNNVVSDSGSPTPTDVAGVNDNKEVVVPLGDDAIKGNLDSAEVVIVEFSDFNCGYCQKFFDETLPSVKSDYIDTGKVALVYKDFPVVGGETKAEIAECVGSLGDDAFFAMHDAIFTNPNLQTVSDLQKFAAEIGYSEADLNECVGSDGVKAEIEQDLSDGFAIGVSGTPSFVVGKLDGDKVVGELVPGFLPYASFKSIIDSYLE